MLQGKEPWQAWRELMELQARTRLLSTALQRGRKRGINMVGTVYVQVTELGTSWS